MREQAARYFARPRPARRAAPTRYDLAIFVNPSEEDPPSDERAIRRFVSAAERIGIRAEVIDKADAGRLSEFDALFLRETTYVNHMTYRLASRAERDGLVVIDDPESILRCTNKVFQAETFQRANIPAPPTWIVHEGTVDRLVDEIDFPCVVKQPDSAFSKGVARAHDERELRGHLARYLAESALVLVQRFVPSEFDWRVGILAGEPLYVCRYFMAKGHWTIQVSGPGGGRHYGKVETLAVEDAPRRAVNLARRVARQFGDGLYGIDIKESNGRFMVIEVNDNPSIESGFEDRVLGKELYERIMADFLRRLEARRAWPKGTPKAAAGTSSR